MSTQNMGRFELDVDTTKATRNVQQLSEAMRALARDTNAVPMTRIERIAIAYVASSTIGNIALLGIAIALLKGH